MICIKDILKKQKQKQRIRILQEEIELIEQKLDRAQVELFREFLDGKVYDPADVAYVQYYAEQIKALRSRIQTIQAAEDRCVKRKKGAAEDRCIRRIIQAMEDRCIIRIIRAAEDRIHRFWEIRMKHCIKHTAIKIPFVRKWVLKAKRRSLISKIEEVEKQRKRAELSLMSSFLTGEEPNPEDKRYFYQYSDMIDSYREEIRSIQKK